MNRKLFHVADGGLENVWLANGFEILDSPYWKTVAFHDLDGLTQAIRDACGTQVGAACQHRVPLPAAGPELVASA